VIKYIFRKIYIYIFSPTNGTFLRKCYLLADIYLLILLVYLILSVSTTLFESLELRGAEYQQRIYFILFVVIRCYYLINFVDIIFDTLFLDNLFDTLCRYYI